MNPAGHSDCSYPDNQAQMITDPFFYGLALPAILIAGISKGGFGGGVGFLAVPVLALSMPVAQAAAIMLPILCIMDLVGLWGYRGSWDRINMRVLAPGAVLGIAVGTASFRYLDDASIRLMVGILAVAFALNHWAGSLIQRRRDKTIAVPRAGRPSGLFWGGLAGFTSFISHAGGPPFSVYMLPQKLDKTLFVGTSVVFFFIVNYVKLIPYGWLGLLNISNLTTALVLAPLAPFGMWLGMWLHRHIRPDWFYRLCYAMVFATGLKLIWDGAA